MFLLSNRKNMKTKKLTIVFSYKFWAYAGAVVTVFMAIPTIKECLKGSPYLEIAVGNHLVKNTNEVTLYYVLPSELGNKFQAPFPISFINNGKIPIHGFEANAYAQMPEIKNKGKVIGYMQRLIFPYGTTNEGIQHASLKKDAIQRNCSIELASDGYKLNFVCEAKSQTEDSYLDSFEFDLKWTFEDQDNLESLNFNVYCISENQYKNMLFNKSNHKNGQCFVLLTEEYYITKQDDNLPIVICKLKDTGPSIVKL